MIGARFAARDCSDRRRRLRDLNVLRLLVTVVLLLRFSPAGGEMAEAMMAMVSDAADDGAHNTGHDPEHGCTELAHHCSCHVSCSADVHELVLAIVPPEPEVNGEHVLTSPLRAPDPQALLRPPAA